MDKNRKAYLESVKRDVAEMLAPENWPNGVPMIRHVRVRGQQVGTVIVAIEPSRYGQLPFQIGLSLCSHRDVFSPHIGIMRALTRRVPANSLLMPKVNGGYSDKGAAAVVTVARCLFDADLRWFNGQHFEEIDKYMAEMGIGKIRGGALPYLDAIAQRNNRLARKAAVRKTCSNCRYWSEMIAKTDDDFNMTAFCINRNNGPKRGTYTRETETCEAWQSGHYGAVDDPHRTDEYVAGDEGGETA